MKRVKWGSVHSPSLLAVGNKESIFRQKSPILWETMLRTEIRALDIDESAALFNLFNYTFASYILEVKIRRFTTQYSSSFLSSLFCLNSYFSLANPLELRKANYELFVLEIASTFSSNRPFKLAKARTSDNSTNYLCSKTVEDSLKA